MIDFTAQCQCVLQSLLVDTDSPAIAQAAAGWYELLELNTGAETGQLQLSATLAVGKTDAASSAAAAFASAFGALHAARESQANLNSAAAMADHKSVSRAGTVSSLGAAEDGEDDVPPPPPAEEADSKSAPGSTSGTGSGGAKARFSSSGSRAVMQPTTKVVCLLFARRPTPPDRFMRCCFVAQSLPFWLKFVRIACTRLIVGDVTGSSDPFILFSGSGRSDWRTVTRPKNLNPVWRLDEPEPAGIPPPSSGKKYRNRDLQIECKGADEVNEILTLTVMDQDLVGADFLGECGVKIQRLVDDSFTKGFTTLPLHAKGEGFKQWANRPDRDRGTITITVECYAGHRK